MDVIIFFIFFSGSIFLHELGHLLMAKTLGQSVREMHFGFGPQLHTVRLKNLDIVIHAMPFGGYVQLNAFRSGAYDALTLAAGPIMNMVLAFVMIFAGSLLPNHQGFIGAKYQGQSIQEIQVDGTEVRTWSQLNQYLLYQAIMNDKANLAFLDQSHSLENSFNEVMSYQVLNKLDLVPVQPEQTIMIQQVDHPCLIAQVKAKDQLLTLNDHKVYGALSLIYHLNQSQGDKMTAEVKNNKGEKVAIRFMPGVMGGRPILGLNYMAIPMSTASMTVKQSAHHALMEIILGIKLQFAVLSGLLSWQLSLHDLSGPIGLYHSIQGIVTYFVFADYVLLFGKINLILGLFNLLPIPPLDGGSFLMRLIIGGNKFHALRILIARLGLIVIIEIGIYTTLNDMNILGISPDVPSYFSNLCD